MVGTKALNIKTNENQTDNSKFANVKKFGVASTDLRTKRAALGDIQNQVLRAVNGKETAGQKDLKLKTAFQNAKATVDSRWKKAATAAAASLASTNSTTTTTSLTSGLSKTAAASGLPKPVAPSGLAKKALGVSSAVLKASNVAAGVGGLAGERKILTRSNSLRLGGASATASNGGIGLQRQGSNNLILGQYKARTVTTKLVDTKPSQVKIATKVNKVEEKTTVAATALRREDSNLSRKSLTRLKAALNRDPTTAAVAKALSKPTTITTQTVKQVKEILKPLETLKSIETTSSSSSTATVSVDDLEIEAVKHDKLKTEKVESVSASVPAPAPFTLTHSAKLLLDEVEDIDAGDSDNLILVSEYVNDIYHYLYSVEHEQLIVPDHMEHQLEVTPRMRAVLVDWINEVASQFQLAVETFQMSVGIIDRYLQQVKDTKRPYLQLVGVTALFIAAKYEELFPPAIADYVYITDNAYSARQIRQMELKIFKALDYNLARPLPIHFLRRFSKATYAQDTHHAMAKYFCELAMVEYEFASYKPSEIAAASLYLALHLLNDNANLPSGFRSKHWSPTLEYYSHYSSEHLKPISKKIATVARNAPNAKLKAVYLKYGHISKRSEIYGALIDSIISSSI